MNVKATEKFRMNFPPVKAGLLIGLFILLPAFPQAHVAYGQDDSASGLKDDLAGDSGDDGDAAGTEQIEALTTHHEGLPIRLKNGEGITTKASFTPPIAITIVAKTNGPDLRISYAADQVIFDWANNQEQLRVDGGPADGHHKMGEGRIPVNEYVTIRWEVTPGSQKIYVDGDLRLEHHGDYSQIKNPITVFPGSGAVVTVKSIRTKPLPNAR